jgi:hypothetical protein
MQVYIFVLLLIWHAAVIINICCRPVLTVRKGNEMDALMLVISALSSAKQSKLISMRTREALAQGAGQGAEQREKLAEVHANDFG